MKNIIKTILKWGRVTDKSDDSDADQVRQVETIGGKPKPVYIVMPFGMSANIPADATVVMLSIGGSGQDQAGIPTMPENRFTGLKSWEVKIGNYKTRANVFFNEDGQIELVPTSEVVLAGGETAAIKKSFADTTYPAHTHATGFGPSGPVNEPVPSTDFNEKVLV